MIPFFVADRPMSLRILANSFRRAPHVTVGLLAHAQVSDEFARLFAEFPAGSMIESAADAWPDDVVRIGDSGIFRGQIAYGDLFARYEHLRVRYGIMRDVLGDGDATLASAREAVRVYARTKPGFELVLVAQGKSVADYINCYRGLRRLGPFKIAIGGLLRKRLASVRYLYVGSEHQMYTVLSEVRQRFDPDWSFVLGAYHPSRHGKLDDCGVYGADYKGWIFQYAHRRDVLMATVESALCEKLVAASTKRRLRQWHSAALIESEARKLYARTKNIDAKHVRRKRALRELWLDSVTELQRVETLLRAALSAAPRHILPTSVSQLRSLLDYSEREIRFEGVHRYLSDRVYPQCASGASERRILT